MGGREDMEGVVEGSEVHGVSVVQDTAEDKILCTEITSHDLLFIFVHMFNKLSLQNVN